MRITQTLIAVRIHVRCLLILDSLVVNPTKMGTVPNGLIIEKRPAKIVIKSSIVFCRKIPVFPAFPGYENVKCTLRLSNYELLMSQLSIIKCLMFNYQGF